MIAVAAVLGLMSAAGTVALGGPWDGGQRTAERVLAAQADHLAGERSGQAGAGFEPGERPGSSGDAKAPGSDAAPGAEAVRAPTAGLVLDPLGALTGPDAAPPAADQAAALSASLAELLGDPALGKRPRAVVLDAATGEELFSQSGGRAAPPASTVKIVTAVAALQALGPDHRLATRTVYDEERNRVVLVGGGDTTLTADELTALAERTAAVLHRRGVEGVGVGYQADLYSGPEAKHPIGVNDNIAPLTSLMVDSGRLDGSSSGPAPRAADPAADAAEAFVRALSGAGIEVKGSSAAERTAPPTAEQLAVHHSAPVSALVEQALTDSDNDLAEALARQVAVAEGLPPSLDGVARALTDQLDALGIPLKGVRIADGSGLDRSGRLTAGALARLVAVAAEPDRPELRPALTGLPVAGFTGTLTGRYAEQPGAGVVRAKTGTLTGVNALAGTAVHPDGRVLAFAFLTSGTPAARDAEAILDRAAGALTRP